MAVTAEKKPLVISASGDLYPAVEALRSGGLVCYPTETFYGLGVDPFDAHALERLFSVKGREEGKPISVLVSNHAMLVRMVRAVPAAAELLIEDFWPGPLTIILPASKSVPERLVSGTGKVGVRVSSSPVCARLVEASGVPVTTTSANPAGKIPARTAAAAVKYFGDAIDVVVDGGELKADAPSTVVDLTGAEPLIVREGAVSARDIFLALEKTPVRKKKT